MWISVNTTIRKKKKKMKKLTCHCGGVEAEINVPKKGFKKLCVVIVLYVKEKDI